MSYAVALTVEARHDLARLPIAVRRFAVLQLQALGEYPTKLSQPTFYPYPAKCQLFMFDYDDAGEWWELCAMFQYGQDEQSIIVLKVGWSKPDPWARV